MSWRGGSASVWAGGDGVLTWGPVFSRLQGRFRGRPRHPCRWCHHLAHMVKAGSDVAGILLPIVGGQREGGLEVRGGLRGGSRRPWCRHEVWGAGGMLTLCRGLARRRWLAAKVLQSSG